MAARFGDFIQTFLNLFFVVNTGTCNIRHADDNIHRGSDVVTHIGKKLAFGSIGSDFFISQIFQFLHMLVGVDREQDERNQESHAKQAERAQKDLIAFLVVSIQDILHFTEPHEG